MKISFFKNVYRPTRRSSSLFFLKSLPDLPKNTKTLLDLGCGSGVLGIYYKLKNKKINITFADVKKYAIKNTEKNLKQNKIFGACINTNLFDKITKKYDVIIFNVPYDHVSKRYGLNQYDYRGKLFSKFLNKAKNFLNRNGKIFFTFSNLSRLDLLKNKDFELKIINVERFSRKEIRILFQGNLKSNNS